MELLAGKTPAERNKIIAAIVLGILAVIALFMAFGPSFRSKAGVVTPPVPSPTAGAATSQDPNDKFKVPNQTAQNSFYLAQPVVYNGVSSGAPESGRNIFAFYEPPPPTPYVATPIPVKTPVPTPTPPVQLAYFMPQNIYAGSGGFRLEVNGDKFTPDTKIYFNQSQMPTSFISPQRMTTEIPAALVANEGPKAVEVRSADGKLYSTQLLFSVQPPPKPQFQYIGMIARKRYNNDTAYFLEPGKQVPVAARLNDVVGGRFRLMSISSDEAVLEDVNLGFRHRLALVKTPANTSGNPNDVTVFPGGNPYQQYQPYQQVPGINPNSIPRYIPPQQGQRPKPSPEKKDSDSDDDTDN